MKKNMYARAILKNIRVFLLPGFSWMQIACTYTQTHKVLYFLFDSKLIIIITIDFININNL